MAKQSQTALLNDFEPLVTVMVSESFEVSDKYRVAMQAVAAQEEKHFLAPPSTQLDMVKRLWETVMPARELVITGNRIEARIDTKALSREGNE